LLWAGVRFFLFVGLSSAYAALAAQPKPVKAARQGAAMRRFRWVLVVVVLGLAGALVGVAADGVSALPVRAGCRTTVFVTNALSASVSTIDLKTRTKHPSDIPVGTDPFGLAITPDGKTAFVVNTNLGTVSTIDVQARKKNPSDIPVGAGPNRVAVTPDGETAFVVNSGSGTVSTIDVKTRKKNPTDITVGPVPYGLAVTPDGKTVFVTNNGNGTVSTIDVKTRTKHPTDISVGTGPKGVAVTPDGRTAFVVNGGATVDLRGVPVGPVGDTVSTIDVKTRTKHPDDISVGRGPIAVAITPDGKTAFVSNLLGVSMSTIDVKTRTKHPNDITGTGGAGLAIAPDGKTVLSNNANVINGVPNPGTVSTIDVKTRTKHPDDIPVGQFPFGVAVTPCRR
jgi:YVTN family beta-propeller protein